MPIVPFNLSERAGRKRTDFRVFILSALIGTFFGILAALLSSIFLYPNYILVIIVIFGIITLVFYTMKIVLKPEKLHSIIPIGILYDRDNGSLLPIAARLPSCFIEESYMRLKKGMTKNSEFSNVLRDNNFKTVEKFLSDIIIYELFDWLSQKYEFWWAPKIRYRRIGLTSESYKGKNEISSIQIDYSKLSDQLEKENSVYLASRSFLIVGTVKIIR